MQFATTVLYLFALFAFARAQLAAHNSAAIHYRAPISISARQAQASPPPTAAQCNAICRPTNTELQACANRPATRTQCICKPALEKQVYDCSLCMGQLTTPVDYTKAQQTLDALVRTCLAAKIDLPILTFPGQPPNRPGLGGVNGAPTSSAASSAVSSTPALQSSSSASSSSSPAPIPPPATSSSTAARIVPPASSSPKAASAAPSSALDGSLDLNDPSFNGASSMRASHGVMAVLALALGTALALL